MPTMSSRPSRRDALLIGTIGAALAVGGARAALAQAPRRKLAVNIVNTTGNAALILQYLIRQ